MKKEIKPLLLFNSEDKEGVFSQWMQHQKSIASNGHTLITTFDIEYEFVSKALNGLFYNKHDCTILRSRFPKMVSDTGDIQNFSNINIYPYQKHKKTHAKALISISDYNEPHYFIALGSANITQGGFGGGNLEFIEAFSNFKIFKGLSPISKAIKEYLIETFLPVIADEVNGLPKRQIEKIAASLKKVKGKGDWPQIMGNQNNSLIAQMLNTNGQKISNDELHILSPYHGTTRNIFNDHFSKPRWIIGNKESILQVSNDKYDFHRLNDDRALHAKAYLIKRQVTYLLYYGSANCSENALCKTVDKNGGQLEILLSRKIAQSEYGRIIDQYMGEKAKFESYAEKTDFKEDEGDDSQLLCINIVTKKQARVITLITAKPNDKDTIEISADKTKWVRIKHALLNKKMNMKDKDMKAVAKIFDKENLKWIYQKISKDIFPVPINYEGELSYNIDVNSLEDEIICCLSKEPPKNKKKKKNKIVKAESINYSSLTYESALDKWFKQIRTIKELEPAKEIIEKLIEYCRDKKYKYEFLQWYFGNKK